MLLLPNASCCKSITCGKLQNKPLEALGNSTDFMLLALADRHLPQPAGCGNYNLLPLHYLFLYLYRLYQYLAAFPTSVSASKFPQFFLIFQDSRSLDFHPPKTGSVFRAMVAGLEGSFWTAKKSWRNNKVEKKSWVETTPGRCPQVFQLQTLQTSDLGPFLTQNHIFLDRKMLVFQTN